MIKFIDRWLEKKIKKKLHANRAAYLENIFKEFELKYPNLPPEKYADFREKILTEATRVYPIVDRSVLKAGILRARWTFWIGLVVVSAIAGTVIVCTGGSALIFVMPLAGVIVGWSILIATIPFNYNQRIKGGLDSAMALYERSLAAENNDVIELGMSSSLTSAQIMSVIKNNPGKKIIIHASAEPLCLEEKNESSDAVLCENDTLSEEEKRELSSSLYFNI